MQLTDPQVKQFRTRYITVFQELLEFVRTEQQAIDQEDEELATKTAQSLFKRLESYAALDQSFGQYCGFGAARPSRSPSNPQQPTRRPSQTTQRDTQTQQFNAQLKQAVEAKNWAQAIQIVDRLIVLHPERANELSQYRARLVQLRNSQ